MSKMILIEIARSAILKYLLGEVIDREWYISRYPELQNTHATFVTLTLNGVLKGCIGSIIAHRALIDDLISNAHAAAFKDPRFSPLTLDEYTQIHVEVSLLTEPEKVDYEDIESLRQKIVPGKDGVIVRLGNTQATFLPQVWDQLPTFDLFFSHLGMKAGIGSDPLSFHPEIYIYQVEKIEEK